MSAHVMVVDDDEAIRTMLEILLRRAGHDVETVPTGADALRQLRAGPLPDLVLLDIMMPGVSGWDVIEEMSETPRLAGVPVVLLTAFGDGAELATGRPVLHKPVDGEVLRAMIDEVVVKEANAGVRGGPRDTPGRYGRRNGPAHGFAPETK